MTRPRRATSFVLLAALAAGVLVGCSGSGGSSSGSDGEGGDAGLRPFEGSRSHS